MFLSRWLPEDEEWLLRGDILTNSVLIDRCLNYQQARRCTADEKSTSCSAIATVGIFLLADGHCSSLFPDTSCLLISPFNHSSCLWENVMISFSALPSHHWPGSIVRYHEFVFHYEFWLILSIQHRKHGNAGYCHLFLFSRTQMWY